MIYRWQLRPVGREGTLPGGVLFDDRTGLLNLSEAAADVLAYPRAQAASDLDFGRSLVDGGWSNGALYLDRMDAA